MMLEIDQSAKHAPMVDVPTTFPKQQNGYLDQP
jgi:hypothetical protein